MAKQIAFCADGTWDTPTNQTNVYKLFKALPVTATQFPSYDDGIGADGLPLERLIGGAFGDGLFQKIKEGYTKIAQLYEKDDDIFIFGFSRGAYTARCLAGMIAVCGLPTQNFDDNLVNTAFTAYRDRGNRAALLASLSSAGLYDAKIKMVGVWDTVGSLGIPAIFGAVDPVLYGFLDTGLHSDVLNAYHALAIDEHRQQFPATLWTSQSAPGQTLEQVWFCGPHCDVGGGYPETGLSDITLSWMMSKARDLGLQISDDVWPHYSTLPPNDVLSLVHNSWNIGWGIPVHRPVPPNATLRNSVQRRVATDPTYRPQNLQYANQGLATSYQIV